MVRYVIIARSIPTTKRETMTHLLYVIDGHIMPFESNAGKKLFVTLRPRNVTVEHMRDAARRVSAPRIEALKMPSSTQARLSVGLFSQASSLNEDEINEALRSLNIHLKAIVHSAGTPAELRERRAAVREHLSITRDSKEKYRNNSLGYF